MYSSQNSKQDIILAIYQSRNAVFLLRDIALLTGETNRQSLSARLNYYVSKGKLRNPRKGIYTKPDYTPEELANKLYTPSYISLEYVLQKSGINFQYNSVISSVSYLRRAVEIEGLEYSYHRIRPEILVNPGGVIQTSDGRNIATPERALLDTLYLNPSAWFDNLMGIDVEKINDLVHLYASVAMVKRVRLLFVNG